MTSKREILTNYCEFEKPEKVGLGDGHTVDVVGEGNVLVNMQLEECEPRESDFQSIIRIKTCLQFVFSRAQG